MSRPARFALRHPVIEGIAIVDGDELHHLRDVMRMREGAAIALLTADRAEHIGRIERFEDNRAIVRIEKTIPSSEATPLILAAAVIKGPRMDFMVEKAAELGVTELWPTLCARGVVRAPGEERIARWRRLATAAAKQSFAPTPLLLHEATAFADLIHEFAKDTLAIGASNEVPLKVICTMGAEPIASVIWRSPAHGIVIACGPEGDFDDAEMALAKRAGFVAAGLGINRLRGETAAIAAVSIASAILDEIHGGD
jgi:16S rRNA (uracil1498-N3)-methyltransferase